MGWGAELEGSPGVSSVTSQVWERQAPPVPWNVSFSVGNALCDSLQMRLSPLQTSVHRDGLEDAARSPRRLHPPLPPPHGDPIGRAVVLRARSPVGGPQWQPRAPLSASAGAPGAPGPAAQADGAPSVFQVPILVPCHRVVCSGGTVGNYSGGLGVKEWLLDHEGSLVGTPARAGGSRLARTRCGALRGSSSSESAGGD